MTLSVRLRLAEIQHRRELLVNRAAIQRGELAAVCAEFRRPLHVISRVVSVAEWLRTGPGAAGVSMLTALLATRRVRRWVGRAVMLYQLLKLLRERFATHQTEPALSVRSDMEAT